MGEVEAAFLRVTALAVLELALVVHAGLKLKEIHLPLPPGIKGMYHYRLATRIVLSVWVTTT